jgi:hypothetical protein
MLDPLEVLVAGILGVPSAALVVWLLWVRLLSAGGLSFGQSFIVAALAVAIVGGLAYGSDPELPLLALVAGLAIGFFTAWLAVDYVDDWEGPSDRYALGCGPLAFAAFLVLAFFMFRGALPHLSETVLVGGLGGPAIALLLGLSVARVRSGPLGCLPILVIGAIAAIGVGALDWYFADWHNEDGWYDNGGPSPLEFIGAGILAFIGGVVTLGLLDRYRQPDEAAPVGCLPPLGVLGVVFLALILAGQNLIVIDGGGLPIETARPTASATSTPSAASTLAPASASPTAVAVITPNPTTTPSPTPVAVVTPVPTPRPPTPSERTEFIDFLVNGGLIEPSYNGVSVVEKIESATIYDPARDFFKADAQQVDVERPPDIQAGYVGKVDGIPSTIRDALYAGCGQARDPFFIHCGENRDGEGTLNIIWISLYEPLEQFVGGPLLFADRDADTSNNPTPPDNLPLLPSQTGDTQFNLVPEGNRSVFKLYDFNRPGEFRRSDGVIIFGRQSIGWLIFGDYQFFTPLIEKFEGQADYADDVLGPLPVAGEPFPRHAPYELSQICGGLCTQYQEGNPR